LGIGGGVSRGIGILLISSGTSSSLVVPSFDPLRLLPSTPGPESRSLFHPRPNVGALSPSVSLAFFTALSSFSRLSSVCSSWRVSLPPPDVTFLRSSICFCIRSGFFRDSFSFKRSCRSCLPENDVKFVVQAFPISLTFLKSFGLVSFALSLYGIVVLFFWHRESTSDSDCVHVLYLGYGMVSEVLCSIALITKIRLAE
jgi:hypothetical protein